MYMYIYIYIYNISLRVYISVADRQTCPQGNDDRDCVRCNAACRVAACRAGWCRGSCVALLV